jgi:hypothetical protein
VVLWSNNNSLSTTRLLTLGVQIVLTPKLLAITRKWRGLVVVRRSRNQLQ